MSEIATRYRDRVAQLRTGGYESAAQYLEWLFDDIEKLTEEDLERLPLTDTDEQLATWTEEERAQVLALINGVSQAKTERDVFPAIRDREEIGTSTKIPQRGITAKTQSLRAAILREFEHTGKPVTVRQMFYRCSVAGAVEKEETGYRRVQRQLLAMRREGLIPYDWISDNTRWMRKPNTYTNLSDFLERSVRFYRQDLWIRSRAYVEVWCEKDALAGVLMPVTSQYDVPLMVARGYSSETFAYSAAESMRDSGKECYVYYVGDFDPLGWQMADSLRQKLINFGAPVKFVRLAINHDQVKAWNLPTRQTKKADPRCKAFFELFGKDTPSVDLDALHPDHLRALVREAIEQHIDEEELYALRREEEAAKKALAQMADYVPYLDSNDDETDTLAAEHRKQGKATLACGAENVRRYRARQRNAGRQRVELMLPTEAVDRLRRLTPPEATGSQVVAWLILNYR